MCFILGLAVTPVHGHGAASWAVTALLSVLTLPLGRAFVCSWKHGTGWPLSVRGGELTCLHSAQIIHGLQGEKKTFCSCAVARWHGGRHRASTKHLEDVFAVTYSTSILKAQLQSSEEAAVTPLTLPSLVLPPSAACFPLHPLHRLHCGALHGPSPASLNPLPHSRGAFILPGLNKRKEPVTGKRDSCYLVWARAAGSPSPGLARWIGAEPARCQVFPLVPILLHICVFLAMRDCSHFAAACSE